MTSLDNPAAIDLEEYRNQSGDHDDLIAAVEALQARVASLFEAIRHGDAEHEAWLEQAITDHFAGRPVERPRGMGNRERAEAAEARVAELAGALQLVFDTDELTRLDEYCSSGLVIARRKARAVLAATPAGALERARATVPMLLWCPNCHKQHIDRPQPEKNWHNPPHRTHQCQICGHEWRPANIPTVGVEALAKLDAPGKE